MLDALLILNQWLVSSFSFLAFIFCSCRAIFDFAYGRFYQPVGALLFAVIFYAAYELSDMSMQISAGLSILIVASIAIFVYKRTKID